MIVKPCLRCGRPLDVSAFDQALRPGDLTCACGVVYSVEMLLFTGYERWMAIFREDGYRIHDDGGDSLVIEQLESG